MKTLALAIAIAIIASFSIGSAFAQGAKQPEGIAKTAPASPAKAEAPKTEMKLAKKKEDKVANKADTKSQVKPAEKAETSKK